VQHEHEILEVIEEPARTDFGSQGDRVFCRSTFPVVSVSVARAVIGMPASTDTQGWAATVALTTQK
jgi:hypothetical protein